MGIKSNLLHWIEKKKKLVSQCIERDTVLSKKFNISQWSQEGKCFVNDTKRDILLLERFSCKILSRDNQIF